ncbi:hypothetical protein CR513_44952, partial [Mucuna pruriens]
MATIFINTLQSPFYKKMVGNVSSNFSDLVVIDERIEAGVRNGKITHTAVGTTLVKKTLPNAYKKKGREVNAKASSSMIYNHKTPQATPNYQPQFLPIAQTAMALQLFTHSFLHQPTYQPPYQPVYQPTPIPLKPVQPPYPKSYDPNAKCEYHVGAIEHATKRCWGLKHKVKELIDIGWLSFKENGPNIESNLLLRHEGLSVNAIIATIW